VRYLHIQYDSTFEVTNTHILHRIMKIIWRTRRIIYHTIPYVHSSTFPRPQINTCPYDVQHILHHRFVLAIPDRNGLYQELLPLIRAALSREMRRVILTGQRPNRHEHKAIFVTIKHNNDINGYTIRKTRRTLSLSHSTQIYDFESL
jgi:hypothetical protein